MDKPNSLTNKLVGGTTESRIFTAARQEFIEHGFKGARMQSIADRCEVNKALLHYYFRSKERLYQEVFCDIMQTMKSALTSHLTGIDTVGDIRSMLRGIVTVYITTLRANPDFPRFILREIVEGGRNMGVVIEMLVPQLHDVPGRIHKLLEKEITAGTIKRLDPLHLMLNVLGMCIFTFIAQPILSEVNKQLHVGITFDTPFFETRIETILDMVLNGISLDNRKGKGGL